MCRRVNYRRKKHYACFTCRKSFKQRGSSDPKVEGADRPFPCPECGDPMTDMGTDFKAPPQSDVRQWQKVEILWGYGFTYRAGCCDGPGDRPAELSEVEDFLVSHGYQRAEIRRRIKALKQQASPAKAKAAIC